MSSTTKMHQDEHQTSKPQPKAGVPLFAALAGSRVRSGVRAGAPGKEKYRKK